MKKPSGIFFCFLIFWAALNLIQAFFTPIHNDEAYYWMYSKYPAWGYYDHPPMIAMMIRAGYAMFSNQLGVRILIVLTQIATLLITFGLIDKEKKEDSKGILLIVLIIALLPILTITGFLATPDSPLLFFTALFLLFYKRFLEQETRWNTFALAIAMAGLMYSKYHGAILLLLIILSNLRLLKSVKFYSAALSAIILYIPHILWQVTNNFPSFRYHLAERVSGFDISNVPEYLANQLLIHNPLLLPLILIIIFRAKVRDVFARGLKFIIAGFFIFFFAASFRYHVEPQWTALITIPLIILFINYTELKPGIVAYIRWTAIVLIPLFLFARAALMVDFLPVKFLQKEFHSYKSRMAEIKKLAGSRPVVFTNSYQDPSVYTFYTGNFALSLNNKDYRRTQFDLWPFEEQIHGKEVLYLPHWLDDYYKSLLSLHITTKGDSLYYRIFSDFQSLQKECVIYKEDSLSFSRTAENIIKLRIFNPYKHTVKINHPELPVIFQAGFYNSDGYLELKKNIGFSGEFAFPAPGDTIKVSGKFSLEELPAGDFNFVILSETGILYDTFSSKFCKATFR